MFKTKIHNNNFVIQRYNSQGSYLNRKIIDYFCNMKKISFGDGFYEGFPVLEKGRLIQGFQIYVHLCTC